MADEGQRRSGKEASASVTFASLPRAFGEYELLEVIARGGMGVVYRARQKSLNRIVALKMLLAGQFAQPKFIERFRAEAEAVAQMQHPNIVAIHEIGEQDGQQFFSMDYVAGKNLAQISAELGSRSAEFHRCAAWLKTMAEAIHYAHQRGIIHRDLKPSNVLIDPFDQPRITDFGLAKRITGDSDLTLTGQVLGSPNYLPPEQAAGNPARVESDVYALGAILYHLLTGRPPFEAESVTAVLRQVIETEALSPRLLNPGIPRDLETISLKCLEKEPHRRYQTARELAEDLGRFLEGKPIQARPVGAVGKTWKSCCRRPALAGMGLALALTLVLGLSGVLWQWQQASHNAQAELRQRQRAEESECAADMAVAQHALTEGNRGYAARLVEKHRPFGKSELQDPMSETDVGRWEWRYLWKLCQGDELFTLHRYRSAIAALALSPDGKWLAAATQDQVELWDPNSKQSLGILSNTAIPPLAFTSIGLLATATRGPAGELGVALWDVNTRRIVRNLPFKPGVRPGALSPDDKLPLAPDGKLLAISEKPGTVQVVDFASGRIVRAITNSQWRDVSRTAAFAPDGTRLALAESHGCLQLLDLRKGLSLILPLTQRGADVERVAFSPKGDLLAVGFGNGVIRLWDLQTQESHGVLTNHTGMVTAMAFTPDGHHLISAATDWTIRIWHVANHAEERCLWSRDFVGSVVMLPDRKTLVSGADDGAVCFWDAFAGPRPRAEAKLVISPGPEDAERFGTEVACSPGVAFTSDSSRFITTGTNGWVLVGDAQSLHLIKSLPTFGSNHWGVALSPDDRWLATGDAEGKVTVWDYTSGQAVTNFAVPFDYDGFLRFSRSGQYLMASVRHPAWTASVRLWHSGDWDEVRLTDDRFDGVWPVDLSPDDRLLAAGYISGAVKLFQFPSLEDQPTLPEQPGLPGIISGVLFSPDGRELLSVNRYGSVRFWEVVARREKQGLPTGANLIFGSVLSPDGSRLVTGGASTRGALQLWNLVARRETLSFKGEDRAFVHLTFSPDGNILAATGLSGIAHLWRAPSWAEIKAIERAKSEPR